MSGFKFQKEYDFAIELAKAAGSVIKDAYDKPKNVELKCSIADLVTETDTFVEKMILDKIKTSFPNHDFIGEESVAASNGAKVNITNTPTWIIDPVDGTTNFVHSFPYTCVAIGFLYEKQPVFGVIFNPIRGELFAARKGHGATLNGKSISVASTGSKTVKGSLLISEFGSSRDPAKIKWMHSNFEKLLNSGVHGIRSLGSCALNICSVACGRADGFYEAGMHIWDIAGASLILEEAGGFCCDMDGKSLDLCRRRIVACSSESLAQDVVANISTIELETD